jgi:hypothetical protein
VSGFLCGSSALDVGRSSCAIASKYIRCAVLRYQHLLYRVPTKR